jgi:ABC-2 type transport system ATP-binding protein
MLSIQQVSKRYGDRLVLDHLNLEVKTGEIYGLLGPNGAGKTTLINLIAYLLQADEGTLSINNQPVSGKTKRGLGVAPQENIFYRTLTCWENLNFFAQIYGVTLPQRRERIEQCLALVNLLDRAKTPSEKLSGGMQRRLNLAIALIHRPQLLILDEPTTGLDIEARYELWQLIRNLKNEGVTILLTTHLLDEAESLCDRLGILQKGRLLHSGNLGELRQLIPATEILTLQTSNEEELLARAKALGYAYRYYGGQLAFWLPQSLDLKEIISQFEGITLEAIARSPIKLEHIYLELTQNDPDGAKSL